MNDLNEESTEREPIVKRLLPPWTKDLVDAAVAVVSPPEHRQHYRGIVDALLPPIEMFEDILGDAREAIAGDLDATQRIRERLRLLHAEQEDVLSSAREGVEGWTVEELEALRERLSERRRYAPEEARVIPEEGAALLIMAAVHVGQGEEVATQSYLAAALAQLAGYDRFQLLLAEARPALQGNEPGVRTLRDLLDRIDEAADDVFNLRSSVPWPRSLPAIDLPYNQMEIAHWVMAVDTLLAWKDIFSKRVFQDKDIFYTVKLSHSAACAGDLIFITGKGFGSAPGKVRFHVPPGKGQNDILAIGPTSYVDVVPNAWSDTQISVVIPQFASCGKFAIRIPAGSVTANGKTVETFKSIGPIKIGGTLPEILDLRADGVAGQLVTTRGSIVNITWLACPDDATLTLEVKENGTPLWAKTGLGPSGSTTLPVGGVKTTDYTIKLTAKTVCGSASKTVVVTVHQKAKIYLDSLEITQATQFFWGDKISKPANQVPLIAGKPTLVRAYLGSTQDPSFNNGEIKGAQVSLRAWYEAGGELPGSPLQPINGGPFTGNNLGAYSNRKDLNLTANFLIPDSWMLPGPSLRLQATVSLPSGSLDSVDAKNKSATVSGVQFFAAKPLDVVVVLVDYTGKCSAKYPACNGPPSMADAVKTLHTVRRIFPTDKLQVWLPEVGDRVMKFSGGKGCGNCGSFSCLLDGLEDIAKNYDNADDKIWWAAVKVGVGGVGGCGTNDRSHALGYAASRVTDDDTAWHEFGHAYGRAHTFEDSSYPKYGYSDSDSIGAFGVNVELISPYKAASANKHLYSPYTASDFMSYDDDPIPLWVSPYTYMGLMASFFAKKASAGAVSTSIPSAKPRRHREERLVICGTLWPETGEVSLKPLYHMPMYPKGGRGKATRYELALVDHKGRTLVAEAIAIPGESGRTLPAQLRISTTLPFDQETAALEVRDGGDVLLRVERPVNGPTVEDVAIDEGDEVWVLRWHSAHAGALPLLHGVGVTYDDGERWQRLGIGFEEPVFEIDPRDLAGGDRCRLRVYATDGFNTSYADSDSFSLPIKPPQLVLLEPEDGAIIPAGEPVHLAVEAISPRFGSLGGEAIRWESAVPGGGGGGRELWVEFSEGEHELTITSASGPESVAQMRMRVIAG